MKKTYKKRFLPLLCLGLSVMLISCQKKGQESIELSRESTTASQVIEEEVTVDWPFYQIAKEDKVVGHILGTMHIGKKEMYPFPAEILNLLEASSLLLTEVEMEELVRPNSELMMTVIQGKEPITSGMTEESLTLFRKRVVEYGFEEEYLLGLNRFGIEQFFQTKSLSPIAATYGVELQLYSKSKDYPHLKNKGLETVEEQYDILLESYKEPVDVNEWVEMLPSLEKSKNELELLMEDYIDGDVFKHFEGDFSEDQLGLRQKELILDRRNNNWLKVLPNYLEQETGVFVAVGAGHLPTEEGILALLEKAGYQVKKIDFQ